jgi:uncharacterized damage-inducible protein DinB
VQTYFEANQNNFKMSPRNFISELEFEFISTEKLLKRVPSDKLTWQPHPKARTLGELALHVASIPGKYLQYATDGSTSVDTMTARQMNTTVEEILTTFQASKEKAIRVLTNGFDKMADESWHLTRDSKNIFSLPVPFFTRLLVFNHLVHHRGELVVYLRILDVFIPSVYGPSADENPFA